MSHTSIPVKSLMRWPVATIAGAASLRQCAEALVSDELGALAVLENDVLVGVVSERDVVRQVASDGDADEIRARDVMSLDPVTVGPDESAQRAVELMREAAVRHLPVLEDGDLVGFLSIRDLMSGCC